MASLIPENLIDELLTRIDIADVIERRAPRTKARREWPSLASVANKASSSIHTC